MNQENSYSYIFDYIPLQNSDLTAQQMEDRETVHKFKRGECPDFLKDSILSRIVSIMGQNAMNYVVCFMPTLNEATDKSYCELADFLEGKLPCHVHAHINNVPDALKDRKVIVIGDIVTTGTAFGNVANDMLKSGAKSVYGVFVAKTMTEMLVHLDVRYL